MSELRKLTYEEFHKLATAPLPSFNIFKTQYAAGSKTKYNPSHDWRHGKFENVNSYNVKEGYTFDS